MSDEAETRAENRRRFPQTATLLDTLTRAGFDPKVLYCQEGEHVAGDVRCTQLQTVIPYIPSTIEQAITTAQTEPAGRSRPSPRPNRKR